MNPNQTTAFKALQQAQQAMKAGNKQAARRYAELAANSAPELEEVWLMMGALAGPRASVAYLQRALKINPQSQRAQKGLAWATERLRKDEAKKPAPVTERLALTVATPLPVPVSHPRAIPAPKTAVTSKAKSASRPATRSPLIYVALLIILVSAAAIIAVLRNATPASASRNIIGGPAWGQVDVGKSTLTATDEPTLTSTPGLLPTETLPPIATFTEMATSVPAATLTDTPQPTWTPLPSETPSTVPTNQASPTPLPTDTGVPTVVLPTRASAKANNPSVDVSAGVRWIDVNLSQQMVYAYEGNTLVNSFVVSTGTWQYPTVTGQYNIYIKYRYKHMSGPGYSLPNVPYTMFFYKGYALHGTYWHNNFGTPMSHGCVNLTIPDSEWLYNFASVGTLVNVHY